MELLATLWEPQEAKKILKTMIDESKDLPKEDYSGYKTEEEKDLAKAADQADALVDVYYYSLNAAAKKGLNLSSVFKLVHKANMDKRDPATGKFIKRADGKIIKPEGWTAPNVLQEIKRQNTEGSFSQAA